MVCFKGLVPAYPLPATLCSQFGVESFDRRSLRLLPTLLKTTSFTRSRSDSAAVIPYYNRCSTQALAWATELICDKMGKSLSKKR